MPTKKRRDSATATTRRFDGPKSGKKTGPKSGSNSRWNPKGKQTFSKRGKIMKIRPGADPALEDVFAQIGAPPIQEFVPDRFQIEATRHIAQSDCLVTVPTGSGKTWIAVKAMADLHEKGKRAWYASPLKALSNSKYIEFVEKFGAENVGILTGDRKENSSAPIIVGTTEILRNHLYDAMISGGSLNFDLIILDEAHYLGDPERGVVWEEIMIYLPIRIRLLMLSATIGNADQIAQWLSSIRSQKCVVVKESHRSTPLYPLFFHPSGTLFPLLNPRSTNKKNRLDPNVVKYLDSDPRPLLAPPRKLPPVGDILKNLKTYNLLPAIFFLKSRADCDHAVKLSSRRSLSDQRKKEAISRRVHELADGNPRIASHPQRVYLENFGVGAHHSGQLPAWKLILETLMTEGLLNAIFATSTVAAGVNFPARTILFLNSDKFNGVEFLSLNPTEFHQMSGRAGRRGMDKIGFALLIPGIHMDIRHMADLFSSPSSDIKSRIKINFSMVLNLLLTHSTDGIKDLLSHSLAAWQLSDRPKKRGPQKKRPAQRPPKDDQAKENQSKEDPAKEDQSKENQAKETHMAGRAAAETRPQKRNAAEKYLWDDFLRHLDFLKKQGYVAKDDTLSEDGAWASQLRVDQPMIIAQCFRLKIFPEGNPAILAAMAAVFVNEREFTDYAFNDMAPLELKKTFLEMQKRLKPFCALMVKKNFPARPLLFAPAVILHTWAAGASWEKTLRISGLAEGDLAMLILRTADHLRHIQTVKEAFPLVAETAGQAVDLMMREPVLM